METVVDNSKDIVQMKGQFNNDDIAQLDESKKV